MDTHDAIDGLLVEETISFSLTELCRASRASDRLLVALVDEGVLEPQGSGPADWVFDGTSLRRARTATRLVEDLELSPAAAALVLELLARIEELRAQLPPAPAR